jgi:putative tryptophan/tyrosine transport system substrate-binding protein
MVSYLGRRKFLATLGAVAAAWPLAARAQSKSALIGMLASGFADSSAIFVDAFKQGMHENGLIEGRDYVLDVRWAEGDYARFPALAAELAQRDCSVIVVTTIAAGRVAQRVTPTTPLVMAGFIDPVGAGLITSLARPGGNTTGISSISQDTTAKGLELLQAAIPTVKTIAALFNPANPGNRQIMDDVLNHAKRLGVTIRSVEFKGPSVLDATIEDAAAGGPDALLVVGDAALNDLRERIAALALRHRLPTVSSMPEFIDAGGLIAYGPSRRDIYRRLASYVKRILAGTPPANLPVEQPTLIELSINLQTAKALGLEVPPTLLARTDRVIE